MTSTCQTSPSRPALPAGISILILALGITLGVLATSTTEPPMQTVTEPASSQVIEDWHGNVRRSGPADQAKN